MWIETIGKLDFSPRLLGNKDTGKWWVTTYCKEDLGIYLRHMYKISRRKVDKLIRPAWKEHVTIVRDEEPVQKELCSFWRKWSGQDVLLRIFLTPETNGHHWWLPVESEACLNLRKDLGLPRQPIFPLHMTFGHHEDKNYS